MSGPWEDFKPQTPQGGPWEDFSKPSATPSAEPDKPASSSNLDVTANAAWKGVAALPDMVLNAPQNIANLARAGVGTAATAMGRPDLAPALNPNPDLARRGLEAIGLIRPDVVPQGALQKGIDFGVQGAVGGALTGGASLPRTAIGAGMGALSSEAAGATHEATGSTPLSVMAGMVTPATAAKVVSGAQLRPEVAALQKEGIQMTPGQIKGGVIKTIEDAMTSVPLLGNMVKEAQRRGIVSFDTAALNRALAPIGETLPKGLTGNAAVAYVQDKLGDRYNTLRAQMKGSLDGPITTGPTLPSNNPKPTLRDELTAISTMGQNLPPAQRDQLNKIIQNEVIARFTPQGMASGETIKNIESKLGSMSSVMGRSDNYDVRMLGDAVKETQAALRRMVEVENPQHAAQLAKANDGWAQFKVIQDAAARVAAEKGVFTPAQLHSAARSNDPSKDHSRFARGDALMQDLTSAGKSVLPSTIPDSGTPMRLLTGLGLLGGGYGISHHPYLAAGAVGTGAAAALPYTSLGQRALQAFLARGHNPQYGEVSGRVAPIATGTSLADLIPR